MNSQAPQQPPLQRVATRETPEETLQRLTSTLAIVSSIVAGTLLTLYLAPPETVRVGSATKEWIGCCKQFPKGTCDDFVTALAAFMVTACILAFASLVFITAATIKTAGPPFRRGTSTSSIVVDFVAAKWTLIGAVFLTFVVVLLYTPIAYSLTIFILVCSMFGILLFFAIISVWGHFLEDLKHDISLFRTNLGRHATMRNLAPAQNKLVRAVDPSAGWSSNGSKGGGTGNP